MGLQARAIEAQVNNTEADTALKIAQATIEAGEASKKPIELKIEQTNKEITDLEKSLKTQNVEIGAKELNRFIRNKRYNIMSWQSVGCSVSIATNSKPAEAPALSGVFGRRQLS